MNRAVDPFLVPGDRPPTQAKFAARISIEPCISAPITRGAPGNLAAKLHGGARVPVSRARAQELGKLGRRAASWHYERLRIECSVPASYRSPVAGRLMVGW